MRVKFSEILVAAREWLQREGRLTYRVLKREFDLDDESLEDLKEQLIVAQEVAADKDGKMLVWKGDGVPASEPKSAPPPSQPHPAARQTDATRHWAKEHLVH